MKENSKKTIPVFTIDSHTDLSGVVSNFNSLPAGDSVRVLISGDHETIEKVVSDLMKVSRENIVSVGVSLRGNTKINK